MKIRKILYLLALLLQVTAIQSQTNDALYYMWGVPQTSRLNPALNPIAGFYAGFGVNFSLNNSLIHTSDALKYDPAAEETVTILGSLDMQNDFLNQLSKSSIIGLTANSPWQFGFRANKLYLGLEFGLNSYANSLYPKDLFSLIINGNSQQSQFDLGNLGADVLSYTDFSIRTAYSISDKLTIGMRNKLLVGLAYASTANSDITANLSQDVWTFDTNIELNLACANLYIENFGASAVDIDTMELQFKDEYSVGNTLKNTGLGLDLGAQYKFNKYFEVSASVVDLGYINWKGGVYNMKQSSVLTYSGFQVNIDSASFSDETFTNFADSLKEDLYLTYDNDPIRMWLPTKIFIGGRANLNDKLSLAILSKTTFYKEQLYESITVSANGYPFKRSPSLTLAYTWNSSGAKDKLSIGWMSRLGTVLPPLSLIPYPIYTFFMFDMPFSYPYDDSFLSKQAPDFVESVQDIPVVNRIIREDTKVPIPELSGITFMWGFYIRLGFNKEEKLKKDEPLFYF